MKKFLQQRNERLFNKLFENQGVTIKELDVAKMAARQAIEEEELEESDYLPAGAENKVGRFMSSMKGLTKTVDTKQEAAGLIKMVLTNVKELVGDKLTPQEIVASLKLVLKDMAADAKKVATDVASDISNVEEEGLEEGNPGVIKGPGDEELPGDEESAGEEEDLPIAQQSQK